MITDLFEEIYAKILEYDTIIIHRHVRPDPDALGSQLGLKALITKKFPEKKVYAVGTDVENLSFMGTMDQVENEAYENALVIITDTANRPRIDDKRYTKGKFLIKIDHHPDEDIYGDISLVNTQASSCSEIIADLAISLDARLPMNAEAARLFYGGIIGDTGRFLYPATTSKTMRIVSELMEYDFSASEMGQMMNTNSKKIANLSGYVLQNIEVNDLGVAHVILTQEALEQFGADDSDTAPVVPLPGTIEGIVCWGIFVEQATGGFRCRLRSKGPVINEVAKRHGGGGHPLASGANAADIAEIEEIIREFDELVVAWQK
ncbi:DHH family phosphoesterase [Jeotgalibaca sp. A122]|uniref:DHH family phosphoesterase n=1 Tax=Jeotgalibaca sp. A122 TaxID=3457322 RepID=UPI003FD21550